VEQVVVTSRTNSPKNLVRLITKLQIEPAEFSVVATNDKVITGRMDIHGRYPFDPRQERFEQLLGSQVIHPHVALGL
jgi:hypothetical protein